MDGKEITQPRCLASFHIYPRRSLMCAQHCLQTQTFPWWITFFVLWGDFFSLLENPIPFCFSLLSADDLASCFINKKETVKLPYFSPPNIPKCLILSHDSASMAVMIEKLSLLCHYPSLFCIIYLLAKTCFLSSLTNPLDSNSSLQSISKFSIPLHRTLLKI